MTDPSVTLPASRAERAARGKALRRTLSRRSLAALGAGERDPLGILAQQEADRVAELLPLRAERMAASPFTFYRGTAALMAADLARDSHTDILVPSCGDAHVSNFGFYASPQRTLLFDLNDFDEAAWAPWDWDLKRMVTSIVIGGQATSRDESVVREAVLTTVRAYARAIAAGVSASPLKRYFAHFDTAQILSTVDSQSTKTLRRAVRAAQKRTGERAANRVTELDENGILRFIEEPPRMTRLSTGPATTWEGLLTQYEMTTSTDILLLLRHYVPTDIVRRVVGVGSVGTRCDLVLFQDGDGNALLLQVKEATTSVLVEYGGVAQPRELATHIEQFGNGARVVSLQRVLQALSDPFLGHVRDGSRDYYVRQFHDMKGSIEIDQLDDQPFLDYAQACAITLARAHVQSRTAAEVSGYIGSGRVVGEALLEWSFAYAERSRQDYELFLAALFNTAEDRHA